MFNIGGILSGIGDVADTTVRQGRRNKHDIEQINLRDKLARERQKEQFKMSRQEKFLARKEARKDRAKTLQLLGVTNPATIAYLSESDSTLQMVQDLRNNLDKKSEDTGEYYDIQDYIVTTKEEKRGDSMREGEKITTAYGGEDFNLQSYLEGDLDPRVDFQVSFAKQYLGPNLSSEKLLERKFENWTQSRTAFVEARANGVGGEKLKALEATMNKNYDKWHIQNESIKHVNAKRNLENLVLERPDSQKILKEVKDLDGLINSRFNQLKEETAPDDPLYKTLQLLVMERLPDGANILQGQNVSQQDKDVIYNIVAAPILDAHFKTYEGQDDKVLVKEAVMRYFDRFITTKPQDFFSGEAFIDASQEIPTANFLSHLQKRGADNRTIIQQGLDYRVIKPGSDRIKELFDNYKRFTDRQALIR